MALRIAPDTDGFAGSFRDLSGMEQDFLADRIGDSAQAVIDLNETVVLMEVAPLPYGAEVSLIPIGADGNPDLAGTRILAFLRAGLREPVYPPDYGFAPRDTTGRIAANTFIASYVFWRPSGVVRGYQSLSPKFRTLMRLFPAVQLDVIWKMCLAPRSDSALATALRGEPVTCDQVVRGLDNAQRAGRYRAYRREVEAQADVLRQSVRCADNYVMPAGACDAVAAKVAEAATRLETSASVLSRYE